MSISSGVGGNLGGPQETPIDQQQQTAAVANLKTTLALVRDTLEIPFTLMSDPWKYTSSSDQPVLSKPLGSVRSSGLDDETPSNGWEDYYQDLVAKLPQDLQDKLELNTSLSPLEQNRDLSDLNSALVVAAKSQEWEANALALLNTDQSLVHTAANQRLPYNTLSNFVQSGEDFIQSTEGALRLLTQNHPEFSGLQDTFDNFKAYFTTLKSSDFTATANLNQSIDGAIQSAQDRITHYSEGSERMNLLSFLNTASTNLNNIQSQLTQIDSLDLSRNTVADSLQSIISNPAALASADPKLQASVMKEFGASNIQQVITALQPSTEAATEKLLTGMVRNQLGPLGATAQLDSAAIHNLASKVSSQSVAQIVSQLAEDSFKSEALALGNAFDSLARQNMNFLNFANTDAVPLISLSGAPKIISLLVENGISSGSHSKSLFIAVMDTMSRIIQHFIDSAQKTREETSERIRANLKEIWAKTEPFLSKLNKMELKEAIALVQTATAKSLVLDPSGEVTLSPQFGEVIVKGDIGDQSDERAALKRMLLTDAKTTLTHLYNKLPETPESTSDRSNVHFVSAFSLLNSLIKTGGQT